MRGRNISQNYYKSTLSAPLIGISSTGTPNDEFEIQVSSPPTKSRGWVVVDFADTTKRDIIFYHNKVGNILKYYRKNRDILASGSIAVTHNEKAVIQMNDFSEWFNYVSYNTDDWGMVEHIGSTSLTITVLGGFVNHFGTIITSTDTAIAIPVSVTRSIVFDFSDNTFKAVASPTATQYTVAEVITNATTVTSIIDKRGQVVSPLFDTTEFEVVGGLMRIKAGAINTTDIADNAITNAKMDDNSVNTAEIVNDAITSLKILDNAVTSSKIASNPNLRGYVELDQSAIPSTPSATKARLYLRDVAGQETLWMINSSGNNIQIRPAPGLTAVNATKVGPITRTPAGVTRTVVDPTCTATSCVMNIAINSGTPVGAVISADTQAGQIVFSSFDTGGVATSESGITFYYTIVY